MSLKFDEPSLASQIARLQIDLDKRRIKRSEYDREMKRLLGDDYNPPKRTHPLLKIGMALIGFVVGIVVWYVVYMLSRLAIALVAEIPFIRTILYYPSDASWALTVLPPTNAVFAGAFCSMKISKSAKLFSAAIILLYVIHVIDMIVRSTFLWSNLIIALISIGISVMCFLAKEDEI